MIYAAAVHPAFDQLDPNTVRTARVKERRPRILDDGREAARREVFDRVLQILDREHDDGDSLTPLRERA
jgi:hypothetical protein